MKRFYYRTLASFLILTIFFSLSGCEASEETPPRPEDLTTVTLSAVGDIYLTDAMLSEAKQPDGSYDFSAQFADIFTTTAAADLTIGNFEGNFASAPYSQENGSYPDSLADTLAAAGFDILQTANTYSIFNGISGMERTRNVIREHAMTDLGTYSSENDRAENQVLIREINGIRIAFVAFTKGLGGLGMPENNTACVNLLYTDYTSNYEDINTSRILSVLKAAKDEKPDMIVAALHWGSENTGEISKSQKEIADLMVQNGVDVILGAHSHLVGPVERRTVTMSDGTEKDVVIAYGLGDFCAVAENGCNVSLLLNLELCKDQRTGKTAIGAVEYRAIGAVDRGEDALCRFTVLDVDNAIALYESNYYDRVNEQLYERLLSKREKLDEAVTNTEE